MPYKNDKKQKSKMQTYRKAERAFLKVAKVKLPKEWQEIRRDFGMQPQKPKKKGRGRR